MTDRPERRCDDQAPHTPHLWYTRASQNPYWSCPGVLPVGHVGNWTEQPATARPRSCPTCHSVGPPLALISRLPAEVLCTDPWHGPLLHRCTDQCVCPIHGTPLIYAPASGEHACQDVTCVHGHGLQSGDPRTPDPKSGFVSGERWADQLRRIVTRHMGGTGEEEDRAVADLTAWAVEAGNVRWRQGYAAGGGGAALDILRRFVKADANERDDLYGEAMDLLDRGTPT